MVLSVSLAAWLVLVADAFMPDALFLLSPQEGRLLVGVASVGTLAWLVRHLQRPVEEVFDAGREYERRRMVREMNRTPKVVPIRRAPHGLSEFNRSARV
jgi:hypothetical protein